MTNEDRRNNRGADRLDNHLAALKDMINHPPPHPDPAAFRTHIASRIDELTEAMEKARAALPPELRSPSPRD